MFWLLQVLAVAALTSAAPPAASSAPRVLDVSPDDKLIAYHGRWDENRGTWWGSSGFKLSVLNLSHLGLTLGPHSTAGNVSVGLSVNFGPFETLNVTEGTNVLPLPKSLKPFATSTIRLNVQGWQNNRIQLESLQLNDGAVLLPFVHQRLNFQFIGDSLTAGQYLPNGIDGSWAFLAAEAFRAEHLINAQPGACLTDQLCWGNYGGISGMFFKTEDTGYYYSADHNYTTAWDFSRDVPKPTHVFVHIGANDNAYNITGDSFVSTYTTFLERIRKLNPTAPIFVLTPWGWPNSDGTVGYYYDGRYQEVVQARAAAGDHNMHLIDTTGWVTWDDVFPDNQHPNPSGHAKIAGLFGEAIKRFGIEPQPRWLSPVIQL
ncbi:SGNH hydrolase [Exidia glandulosa HHB12029]|uniref:SGNH hydrolase n=1 Tax=Exidia glandulosa HHB12029 TaxID=1314781 RepID=A0A165ZL84_EXIGL|nr:SGNH hydrolase [Exidia glandulosa HHB12029]